MPAETASITVVAGDFRCKLEMRNGSIVSSQTLNVVPTTSLQMLAPQPAPFTSFGGQFELTTLGGGASFQMCIPMQCFWAFGCEGATGK
jgi:hypothetical protein